MCQSNVPHDVGVWGGGGHVFVWAFDNPSAVQAFTHLEFVLFLHFWITDRSESSTPHRFRWENLGGPCPEQERPQPKGPPDAASPFLPPHPGLRFLFQREGWGWSYLPALPTPWWGRRGQETQVLTSVPPGAWYKAGVTQEMEAQRKLHSPPTWWLKKWTCK